MLALRPANPRLVAKWRKFAFFNSGASTILGLPTIVRTIFPEELLSRFPDYYTFIYAALAVSLISGLLLTMVNKILVLSFAQLGGITSLLYIAYALFGIFSAPLLPVFFVLMASAMLVVLMIFGQSLAFFQRQGAYADLVLGVLLLSAAMFMCAYPLYIIVSQASRG